MHRLNEDSARPAGLSRGRFAVPFLALVVLALALALPATASAATQTLTVGKKGSGAGTVTSSPAGIECGATCSAPFAEGTEVVLTGTSGPNTAELEYFSWSGCAPKLDGKCVVTIGSKPITVTVTFNLIERPLTVTKAGSGTGTVTSSPAGIECGATCSAGFVKGSTVVLTGTPGAEALPVSWTGCDEVTAKGECAVEMATARSVTATFNTTEYPLTVNELGSGTGTVTSEPAGISCGGTCSASYAHGTNVTLTGTPGPHSEAVKWAGCKSEPGGKCLVEMSAAKEVSAIFTLDPQYVEYTLTLRVKGTGQGSVTSAPAGIDCPSDCSGGYFSKTKVKLVATPAPGSRFDHWSGGGCFGTATTCETKLKANRTVNAVFAAVGPRTLTVGKAGNGSGVVTSKPAAIECGSTCSAQVEAPTKVALHAIPAAGSTFTGWSGEGCSGTGACRVLMNEARKVTATFARTSPQHGTLSVRNPIAVKGHRALLRLSCRGGSCKGTLKLIARIRRSGRRARSVMIGKISVSLQAGVSSTRGMRLSQTGTALLRKAGSLSVRVTGGGIQPHRVKLSLRRR
ncbi:MAG: InlB B-repeat-containing protein [Chloroflexota bacterium]